jgi:hypothetical protein
MSVTGQEATDQVQGPVPLDDDTLSEQEEEEEEEEEEEAQMEANSVLVLAGDDTLPRNLQQNPHLHYMQFYNFSAHRIIVLLPLNLADLVIVYTNDTQAAIFGFPVRVPKLQTIVLSHRINAVPIEFVGTYIKVDHLVLRPLPCTGQQTPAVITVDPLIRARKITVDLTLIVHLRQFILDTNMMYIQASDVIIGCTPMNFVYDGCMKNGYRYTHYSLPVLSRDANKQ